MKLALVLTILLIWTIAGRAEETATAPVERLHAALEQVMKDGPALGFDGRTRQLAPVIEQAYDLPTMTRAAVGAQAARLKPEQMDRLVQAFTHYTIATYARQFASYDGERFETATPSPAHGGGMLVPTRIVPATGQPASLTYLMRETPQGWRIEDVLLDGTVSQLAVRRAEFRGVLMLKGPDALVDMLESRAAEQAKP
jgi:phospholipid transport system substrate-binding protein